MNQQFKDYLVRHILPTVQMPAQYLGGELNQICKDARRLRGRLCLAFPDAYTIGMSHYGLQVLYSLMNRREGWACERAFAPWADMEQQLRQAKLPMYSLETYTPLYEFDVLGFSLQYEICYTNLLNMLDLGGIPLSAEERSMECPLVIAGGPCAQNPEPLAPFIDVFVIGDGEESLPEICDRWLELREAAGGSSPADRTEALARLAAELPYAYVPRFYAPEFQEGRMVAMHRTRNDVPATIRPALVSDFDSIPLPTRPIVPYVECVHDRISIEIMRGCPWQCRFCQSTVIKRPLRFRSVQSIVDAAWESYQHTGYNEISLLSLSSSDYPHFEELIKELKRVFQPLGVSISVPSLRVNDQLRTIAELIGNDRRASLTLAPEVARDDMRTQIRKRIKNDDLYEGCRVAFRNNYERVKLYFMCGLPGERRVDLDGIVEMAESIAHLRRNEFGRWAKVTASVSNFVPKAHTPYQWNAMQTREYFQWAQHYLRTRRQVRSVTIKCHDIETSLIEGVLSRGDRRMAKAIELAWQRGARMDGWREHFNADRWWQAIADAGIDCDKTLHQPYELEDTLPWDHIAVKYGREYLEKEQTRSAEQLQSMAESCCSEDA